METSPEAGSVWPLLLGLLAVAIAAVFVARALHQRSRRQRDAAPAAPPVDSELDRATRLRTILPDGAPSADGSAFTPATAPPATSVGSVAGEPVVADAAVGASAPLEPVTAARAAAIVSDELARPGPGQETPDEIAAGQIAGEAAARSDAAAAALATLPVEALPAFGDNVVVARGAGPQLLLATAREVLEGQAEEADAPDFPDPLVRALDGGGACMSLPGGAGAEAALFVLDLLAHPPAGEPVYGEAWVTIRQDDVFLSVPEDEASATLDAAVDGAAALFPESDERFDRHVTAAASLALEARGLPFGARLYAYYAGPEQAPEAHLSLTDDAGGGYVAQWDTLEKSRVLPVDRVRRAWTDIPADARETLGL